MSFAQVIPKEIDLTARVKGFGGVYNAIVIPADRGPLEPMLISSESQLLTHYTKRNKIEVGHDLSYFSAIIALGRSNKLWVRRAIGEGYTYAGSSVVTREATGDNAALSSGEEDPEAYEYQTDDCFLLAASSPGEWANSFVGYKIWPHRTAEELTLGGDDIDTTTSTLNLSQDWTTGEPIVINKKGGSASEAVLPAPLETDKVYYTVNTTDGIKLASSMEDAKEETTITIEDTGTTGSTYSEIIIEPYKKVKTQESFLLEVFTSEDENNPVETYTLSRVQDAKDGYGQNMYLENKLEGSLYLRAYDNPMVDDTTMPKPQVEILYLDSGDDGDSVKDGDMMTAADDFKSKSYPVTVFMDGGWATPAYQKYIDSIAQNRIDCICALSIPYDKESSMTYSTDIVDYRRNVLNIGSSYSGLYSPHVKIYDKWNNRNLYVSPDGFAAAAFSYTAYNWELWYPVGGLKRGQMLNALDVRRRFSEADMSYLYDNDINPIRFYPGKGIRIWGQKTTYGIPSNLDRLNVRCLAIVIEPAIAEALESFLFDQNTPEKRTLARSMVETYMEGIKNRNGVYDYYVQCDEQNNTDSDIMNYRMNLHLYIKPVLAIEWIPFYTVFTPYGMDFGIASETV